MTEIVEQSSLFTGDFTGPRQRGVPLFRTNYTLPPFRFYEDPFPLRPYQQEAHRAFLRAADRGLTRTMTELPPGAGKTALMGVSTRSTLQRCDGEGHSLILVPWLHLVKQTHSAFAQYFPPDQLGIIQAEHNSLGKRVTIASMATLANRERLQLYKDSLTAPLRSIFLDEAHRSLCTSVQKILEVLDPHADAIWSGNTATPYRADRKSLRQIYSDDLIYTKDFRELILEGYLVDIQAHEVETNLIVTTNMLDEARRQLEFDREDWSDQKIEEQLLQTNRYQEAYTSWLDLTKGTKKTIIFAQSIRDAYAFRDYFKARGIAIEVLKSGMSEVVRERILESFQIGGPLQIIVNYNVLTTGANLPQVECVIIGRIMGIGLWTQAVGRVLRLCEEILKRFGILISLVDQQHTLMTMGRLLGRTLPPGGSVRQALAGLLTEEKSESGEAKPSLSSSRDLFERLREVRTQSYDVFTGGGWTVSPVTGEASKSYADLGSMATIQIIPGAYQVQYRSPGGQTSYLNKEPVSAHQAMVLAHQHIERQRQARYFRMESAKPTAQQDPQVQAQMAEAMTQRQWLYLVKRGVGGIRKPKESYDAAMKRLELNQQHYQDAERMLKEYGRSWVPGRGHIKYDSDIKSMKL